MYCLKHKIIENFKWKFAKNKIENSKIQAKAERATVANVELDQQANFDGAMKTFRREINNSNIISELKRRRYHEEAWMMRRRKEKERSMRAKQYRNVMTFSDRHHVIENTIFEEEYGTSDNPVESWKDLRKSYSRNWSSYPQKTAKK
eukprot:gnl/TRDRNA2_/TRDRNA2_177386_c0_seq1.p1 gnl/TRDRNA2_/TRDRNA2_177386_c0~~gnl/TRDRNA2_/TRDRNA2_177386_c0_seq1.p1  ORF type:complete len:147 (+),score=5.27 gnl/TRDRNA2_/TRDRNA2_177386_c0_seq1:32-472(+)